MSGYIYKKITCAKYFCFLSLYCFKSSFPFFTFRVHFYKKIIPSIVDLFLAYDFLDHDSYIIMLNIYHIPFV